MSRGYFGIGIVGGKSPENLGGLWRSAHAFGASFVFTIGARYPRRDKLDTADSTLTIPLFEWASVDAAKRALPDACRLIGVEDVDDSVRTSWPLQQFEHPAQAAYLLGAEDRGLDEFAQWQCNGLVHVPTTICLNVATTGSIVLYDRAAKAGAR